MTRLRKTMLDELRRRNYAQNTVRSYIKAIEDFARYFGKSPEHLGPQRIREYQVHLFRDRKLAPGTVEGRGAALRFLYVKTLRWPYLPDQISFPKRARRLPTVLSSEEVALLIDSAKNLMHRAILMTLYATGLRRAELCRLNVTDIDSERIVIHVLQGKGGRDRDVLLSPKLLATLREYWRWLKPKTWLFSGHGEQLESRRSNDPRSYGKQFVQPRCGQVSRSMFRHTRCDTALRPTCSKQALIFGRFRFCSVTPSLRTPAFICICHAVICKPLPVCWKRSIFLSLAK